MREPAMWRCDCGTAHFLTIHRDDEFGFLTLEGQFAPEGLWTRIKEAWKVLTCKGHYNTWVEITLTDENAKEIAEELTRKKEDTNITVETMSAAAIESIMGIVDGPSYAGKEIHFEPEEE